MISTARANASLGYEFGRRSFTPATTMYLGLSLSALNTNGTGFTEPGSSVGYSRVAITNNTTTWGAPSANTVSNLIVFSFNTFTASLADTQKATYWFLSESATGGSAIYYGALLYPRPIVADSQIWVNVGELKIQRTNP